MSTAGIFNLVLERGVTFSRVIGYEYNDAPVNLTGATAQMHVRKNKGSSTTLLDLNTSNGGLTINGAEGTITILIPDEDTDLLGWVNGYYDLKINYPTGQEERILAGRFSISREVTRGTLAVPPPPPVDPPDDPADPPGPVYALLFQDLFDYPDGLITNEYAHFNPVAPGAIHYGTSENPTLTGAEILALVGTETGSSGAVSYPFAAGGYKYIAYPNTFPAASNFTDPLTGFPVSMAEVSDNAAYSQVSGGTYYALVTEAGVTYRVYRTQNQLGGTFNINVTITPPFVSTSANWDMTSGSFFARGSTGWTGVPDDTEPNALSSNGTNSAIFRLTTKRTDFGDVLVSFNLFQNELVSTPSTPAEDWDGVHIFLRYQSEQSLYYASVNRRDGAVVIKKKCVGGPDNGGTYFTLGSATGFAIPYGSWQNVAASVKNNSDGSVTIRLFREGVNILTATDSGTGCAPIIADGAVGIRGDNDDFSVDNFKVYSLGVAPPVDPPSTTGAIYYGTSSSPTLVSAAILALTGNAVAATAAGGYVFAAGGYKYITYPENLPAASNFVDPQTGFPVSMATADDDPAYASTANGWSYASVTVAGINYRVYRTQYTLGGTFNITVT